MLHLLRKDLAQRRLPVVVISPTRTGETLLDARMLAHRLRGMAHVFRLKSDFWWTKEEFAHICFGGSVRLYHAGYRADDKPGEHRFWAMDEIMPDPEAVARDIVEKVLRDILALEWLSTDLESLLHERGDVRFHETACAVASQCAGVGKRRARIAYSMTFSRNSIGRALNAMSSSGFTISPRQRPMRLNMTGIMMRQP